MKRILFLITITIIGVLTACESTPKSNDSTTTPETKNTTILEEKVTDTTSATTDTEETVQEDTDANKSTSIESDIQFIRDKYAIITNATNYKTIPFEAQCDERSSVKLERKYNEKGELSYLQYRVCGDHGCATKHHYYWDGQLIFIFHKNDYTPGTSHIIEEYRTYFKNGQMIRCLEKKAHYYEGQLPMTELLKNAKNEEVECNSDKLTAELTKMETISVKDAKAYFCQD
ncbi:hypothetical protein H2O64_16420 [Kordia sp. YSTF-M3]|uniref:Lipoprotein n=1 Tax=Kordia aestuariivivens TaxID=2759037 RepID=A0ABR7QCI2_9FLAO|nr:hypothetical protein [Kordia aestuariivivens]MBC8756260.1 hypothetical protein [Kordia aestuariivivens]